MRCLECDKDTVGDDVRLHSFEDLDVVIETIWVYNCECGEQFAVRQPE